MTTDPLAPLVTTGSASAIAMWRNSCSSVACSCPMKLFANGAISSRGRHNARAEGRTFSRISGVIYDFQMRLARLEAAEDLVGPVGGAVVHGNHLCRGDCLGEGDGADAVGTSSRVVASLKSGIITNRCGLLRHQLASL